MAKATVHWFDSDTCLLTDHPLLIEAARRNSDFEVPTSMIKADKANLYYTYKDKANLDIRTSVNKIGEIINLSQELNTKLWEELHKGADKHSAEIRDLYKDIAQLDIMSGCEIDKAKKILPIDNAAELSKLKKKYHLCDEKGRKIRPNFFAPLARSKGYYNNKRVNYKRHHTAMDYLQHSINRFSHTLRQSKNTEYLPLSYILDSHINAHNANARQVRTIINMVRETQTSRREIWRDPVLSLEAKRERYYDVQQACIDSVNNLVIHPQTARSLILAIEREENRDVRTNLFYTLFGLPNQAIMAAIQESKSPVRMLAANPAGEIVLYGRRFSYIRN